MTLCCWTNVLHTTEMRPCLGNSRDSLVCFQTMHRTMVVNQRVTSSFGKRTPGQILLMIKNDTPASVRLNKRHRNKYLQGTVCEIWGTHSWGVFDVLYALKQRGKINKQKTEPFRVLRIWKEIKFYQSRTVSFILQWNNKPILQHESIRQTHDIHQTLLFAKPLSRPIQSSAFIWVNKSTNPIQCMQAYQEKQQALRLFLRPRWFSCDSLLWELLMFRCTAGRFLCNPSDYWSSRPPACSVCPGVTQDKWTNY